MLLAKAKALEDVLSTSKAWAKELEAELRDIHDTVCELELQVSDHEAEITKKEKYITLLEDRFIEATSKLIQ